MKIRNFVPAVGFLVAFAVVSMSAQAMAATLTVEQITGVGGVTEVNPLEYSASPFAIQGELNPGANGDLKQTSGIPGQARSPWTTETSGSSEAFQWVNNGTITYDFGTLLPQEKKAVGASLLWGSPDSYNYLALELGDNEVARIVPDNEAFGFGVPVDPINTYLVSFSGIVFDKLVLGSTSPSFEGVLTSVTPVPIPAAAILFLSGLLGLFALGWRRNRAQGEPQPLAS